MISYITKEVEKISSFFPQLIHLYRIYYKDVIEKEIALGEVSREDNILCIGGGPFPSTAIEIAYKTGANVSVVDCDPSAVKCAKRVIKMLKLNNKIKIIEAKGQEIDPSSFSVIHMALQVFPKDEILVNILSKASQGCRILVRSPQEKLKSCYSDLCEEYQCKACKSICQSKTTMKNTLLYTKDQGRQVDEKIPFALSRTTGTDSISMVG